PVEFVHQNTDKNKVYFVNFDMQQAEVIMMSKGLEHYDPKMSPVVSLFNEYYGGSMASITFQTIRESKALAYAVWSSYQAGSAKDKIDMNDLGKYGSIQPLSLDEVFGY